MPANRTMRFLAIRSGTSLSCAARTCALVGFQGVGNVRFIGDFVVYFAGNQKAAQRRKPFDALVKGLLSKKWRRRESNPQTICRNDLQQSHLQMPTSARSVYWSHVGDSDGHKLAEVDTDLIRLSSVWPELPVHIRQSILTLVNASVNAIE
jgi:hypothetical protein